MPGLRLECREFEDVGRLLKVAPVIHEYLAIATVEALKTKDGPSGVGLKFIYAPGVNVPRIEIYAEVSEGKTPEPQDMAAWFDALMNAWDRMSVASRLASVEDILLDWVGIWPGLRMRGFYGEILSRST